MPAKLGLDHGSHRLFGWLAASTAPGRAYQRHHSYLNVSCTPAPPLITRRQRQIQYLSSKNYKKRVRLVALGGGLLHASPPLAPFSTCSLSGSKYDITVWMSISEFVGGLRRVLSSHANPRDDDRSSLSLSFPLTCWCSYFSVLPYYSLFPIATS
jgi:hypothetical protein